ncbi:MAG TPA: NAD(P)H-dependent glycerol-3-phosphate dehydrogenase [Micromonosporaceae bacterium]
MGAGSWGTAFAKLCADAGREVTIWARREEVAESIRDRRRNPDYLPDAVLPDRVTATSVPEKALDGVDLVAIAVPSHTLRANLEKWAEADAIDDDATVLSLMKGIELGTGKRMTEVIVDATGIDLSRVAVVTGPNLAAELVCGHPAAAVVACIDEDRAAVVQQAIATRYFRPYTNDDVIGCELGGAVKNVIALACGMAIGMGFGDNTKATLITRGLAETARLGARLGADPLTFAGLAGLGDLVGTCMSPLSRNRTFGEHLGRGDTLEQAQAATRQTAEGVKSCLSIRDLAHARGVEMPITEQVEAVCHERVPVVEAMIALMSRDTKPE